MSENSRPAAPTTKSWLESATSTLRDAGIDSARLDAELILAYAMNKERTWIIAHPEATVDNLSHAERLIDERRRRVPIAYLRGSREFYGRDFIVTPSTLIPRPETETLIELVDAALRQSQSTDIQVLDVGTGSGCIGLTLKAEHPGINLTVSDISKLALDVARKNAESLAIEPVSYVVSSLLDHWLARDDSELFTIIVANLPYVDKAWDQSVETDYEPALALFADRNGLALIERLIEQAPPLIKHRGYLALEADPVQHAAIINRVLTPVARNLAEFTTTGCNSAST